MWWIKRDYDVVQKKTLWISNSGQALFDPAWFLVVCLCSCVTLGVVLFFTEKLAKNLPSWSIVLSNPHKMGCLCLHDAFVVAMYWFDGIVSKYLYSSVHFLPVSNVIDKDVHICREILLHEQFRVELGPLLGHLTPFIIRARYLWWEGNSEQGVILLPE